MPFLPILIDYKGKVLLLSVKKVVLLQFPKTELQQDLYNNKITLGIEDYLSSYCYVASMSASQAHRASAAYILPNGSGT